ncbi:WapI family immunity protein [Cryptosporangium minutisporangium]|uniref:WapI family immunity protein n=1 Tax=Cryptosporangium minutisporangium TaxID=113569 RepID=UPI0031EB9C17
MGRNLVIGSLDAEHVAILVSGRVWPDVSDYWDGNWLHTRIQVRVGRFTADLDADLRTDDLQRFAAELRRLDETLSGSAVLGTLEHWIELTVTCEPSGRLTVTGEVLDDPAGGNQLIFELRQFDQTYLAGWLGQLEEFDRAFPTVGRS